MSETIAFTCCEMVDSQKWATQYGAANGVINYVKEERVKKMTVNIQESRTIKSGFTVGTYWTQGDSLGQFTKMNL